MDVSEQTTYRFGPLERAGFILGLRVPQLVGFILAGLVALGFLNAGGFGGLVLAIAVVGLATAILMVPLRGHTLDEWAPLTIRHLFGRFNGTTRFRAQRGQAGHLAIVPDGELDPEPVDEPTSVPAELAGLEYLESELPGYDDTPFGVIVDRRARTMTAVLRCQGQAFALLGAEERERRLADYGGVLAALARDDSPLRRIAWTERTLPANRDELGQYLMDHKRDDATLDNPPDELVSYFQLLRRSPDVAEDHELMFSIQIDTQRAAARRATKRMGGGDKGAMAALASEVSQIADLLDAAGIGVTGVLTRRGVSAVVRNAYDPWGRRQRERGGVAADGISPTTAGPMARDEHWSHVASDGALHSTSWVAEWPRIDVRALFLQPLLTSSQATRAVTMVMELVGPSTGIRRVERAATEAATNQSLRARIGQRTTQRDVQREEATERREHELAKGHAEVRFAAYVTVSVPAGPDALDELEAAVARVDLEAKRAPLRLERMWGQQAEAFTYGALPLGRGLA
ncbi:MAG TPA: SCO6880 family protein [Solirubrobacteraceae bacterium]|nr:SCO6880 family protein [Solirubrobacteraceae bacterium]